MPTYIEHHDWKSHLRNLPTIETTHDWQGQGDFACLVIPVFSFDNSIKFIEDYIAKAAAWSLATWKENADTRKFNVPCYMYVEAEIADAAVPILKENGVPDNHILIREYTDTAWLAKCLQPIFDESLKYQYIVISDIDMFALKCAKGSRLPIFERIKRQQPTGFGCKTFNEYIPLYWMLRLAELYKYKNGKELQRELIDVWCDALNILAGRDDLRQYVDGGVQDTRPWTGVMVSHRDAFSDKEWLSEACNTFGDDEAVIYCYDKASESNLVWDIIDFGIPTYTDILQYIEQAFSERGWEWHLKNKNGLEFKDIHVKDACLLHHFASVDHKFYQLIGIA